MPQDGTASERTRIQLCGRLSVEVDGRQLAPALRGRQVPLLLAYLILNRDRAVGREELIGALWPESAPLSQDAALRTLLSRLRSALGGERVVGREELMLELPHPVWIDLEAAGAELQRARDGLEAGDARGAWALAQVPLNIASRGLLPGAQARWLEAERRSLEDIRLGALEVIGRAGLSLGHAQLASVERAARGLIDAEPYRESGYVLLMEAMALQGNLAEGLRVFESLRALLRDELGTRPSPDALAAHERLLNPQRGSSGQVELAVAPGPGGLEVPAELRARWGSSLVGREPELARLSELWARAQEGRAHVLRRDGDAQGRLALLSGDPGIGKTRLVAELARQAQETGGVVLAGRSPREALVPYQPFVEALRHYVQGADPRQLRLHAREYGAELGRLVPELGRRMPELPRPPAGEEDTDRYRLFEAVVGLFSAISRSAPVLLALDDLQWSDRPTLLLLRHLARAPEPSRMLILGAYRSSEADAEPFAGTLAELRRERLMSVLELSGLARQETSELVAQRAGALPLSQLGQALHEQTEGNPFFVEEIVRHLQEAGVRIGRAGPRELERAGLPEGVKEVIARRLERLSDPAVAVLRVAAVIGRDFATSLLERVVALEEEAFVEALEEGLEAGLIVESPVDPDRHSFSHALIRETLYENMSARRRARVHRLVAEALEQDGISRHLSALAHHFVRAASPSDAEKTISYARQAGDQASGMLAHEDAAEHLLQALSVQERYRPGARSLRLELLLALGEARVRAGERPAAWQGFREAAALAGGLGNGEALARAAIGASRRYVQPPGVVDEELITMLQQALASTTSDRPLVRVALLARLCGALYFSPRHHELPALAQEATALAETVGTPEARALAAAARRRAGWSPRHLEARLTDSTALLTLAREAGDQELILQGHAWLVVDLLEQGDRDGVEAQIDAFLAGAERLRQPLYSWNARVWMASRALLDGDLAGAERLSGEALAIGRTGEQVTANQYHAIQIMAIRREQGRMQELEGPLRELATAYPTRPAWRAALASLLAEGGRLEEARDELHAALGDESVAGVPEDGDLLITLALLAEAAAVLQEPEQTEELYAALLPYAQHNVVIGLGAACLGAVARFLGRLALASGRREAAVGHLEQAREMDARFRATACLAHSEVELALAAGPQTARGRELLSSASATAERLGLTAVARRAAVGGGPRALRSATDE